jgi:pimeloyl-ACP methyl ester carboxylesterase
VEVLVRKLPASGTPERTVVTNPGGPGGDSVQALEGLSLSPLHERFDLVSWDPRGVGQTEPLKQCAAMWMQTGLTPRRGPFTWDGWGRQAMRRNAAANRDCLRRNRASLSFVATMNTVRDLDRLRQALGLPTLDYIGRSYGTTIGRLYAKRYPGNVRTLTLDGVVDPRPTVPRVLANRRSVMLRSWQLLRAELAPPLARRVEPLLKRQMASGASDPQRSVFWGSILNSGRTDFTVGILGLNICVNLLANEMKVPEGCFSATASRATEPVLRSDPAVALVDCGDQTGRVSERRVRRLAVHDGRRGPQFGAFTLIYATLCAGMPAAWNPIPGTVREVLPTPPLLVNSLGDVATPIRGARRAHRAFVGSRLITVSSTTHVLLETNNACVSDAVIGYIRDRQLPRDDVRCPR